MMGYALIHLAKKNYSERPQAAYVPGAKLKETDGLPQVYRLKTEKVIKLAVFSLKSEYYEMLFLSRMATSNRRVINAGPHFYPL
jgi:hypothetical protein